MVCLFCFPAASSLQDKVLDVELSPNILPVDHGSQRYSGGPVTEAHIRHLRKQAMGLGCGVRPMAFFPPQTKKPRLMMWRETQDMRACIHV